MPYTLLIFLSWLRFKNNFFRRKKIKFKYFFIKKFEIKESTFIDLQGDKKFQLLSEWTKSLWNTFNLTNLAVYDNNFQIIMLEINKIIKEI